MPFRHTAPPSAGRPSGMRSDRHESRPMTSESPRPVAPQRTAPAAPHRPASAAPAQWSPTADLTPRTASAWRRRSLLRLVGATAVGVPALSVLAACAEDDTVHAPDPLAAQEVLARADAASAQAAIALAPQAQAALTTVAAERTAHADALRTEIDRVIGVYGDGTTPVHRTGEITVPGPDGALVPAATIENATQPLTIAQLRDQLVRSQQSAAALARTESGYRAGLLASISAACATEAGVLLA
ncbi:hypothetical protein [Nocardia sp. NPDC050718]|uniref:hypothetical protein n=1 Tax=Nocardia sp. NPDC050718 TaxID=3155788 RepID=UPI003408DBF2